MASSTLILIALGTLAVLVVAVLAWRRSRQLPVTQEPAQIGAATRPAASSVGGRFLAGLSRSRDALARGLAKAFSGGASDPEWQLAVEEALA